MSLNTLCNAQTQILRTISPAGQDSIEIRKFLIVSTERHRNSGQLLNWGNKIRPAIMSPNYV